MFRVIVRARSEPPETAIRDTGGRVWSRAPPGLQGRSSSHSSRAGSTARIARRLLALWGRRPTSPRSWLSPCRHRRRRSCRRRRSVEGSDPPQHAGRLQRTTGSVRGWSGTTRPAFANKAETLECPTGSGHRGRLRGNPASQIVGLESSERRLDTFTSSCRKFRCVVR